MFMSSVRRIRRMQRGREECRDKEVECVRREVIREHVHREMPREHVRREALR